MKKKKYYAITAKVTFEKTVLVPVDSVEDMDAAIDLVDCGVEVASVMLLSEQGDFETKPSPYADENGMLELSDEETGEYQILRGDE